ncbi:MAG: hypothetical protein ACTHL8_23280 [Burkholderiaceae bacterium]
MTGIHAVIRWLLRSPRAPGSLRDAAWGAAWFTIVWAGAALVTYALWGEAY